ncbi:cytochrome P450 72A14-like [Impatiens glandulifera]|uniref:cytochrome P450 72A14-like n=1 Tax=Impatiens glandulifera TaxID=253017 RepID=UPI001FB0923D|nr:cytochrome P450 72A14-like [Impatiens glandulifera]
MIHEWEKKVDVCGEDCEIEISSFLQNMTSDVISRTAFGSSYKEGMKIFEIQQKQADLVYFALQSPIPWFLPTKTNKKIKEMKIEIDRLVKVIIERREKSMGKGEGGGDGDLLGVLLENNLKEKVIKNDDAMSIEDVIEECKLFYFTGQVTTSNLLVWAIVSLGIHSEWQTLARDEIRQAFGDNVPDFDGLNRLKIVTMILYEVLRLYPPSPMMMRVVQKETKIGHMSLPAGSQLMVPIIFIHRDRQLWGEDVEEFKPERFAKGLAAASDRQGSFLPFGGGPRTCIGNNFAMMEAKMALSLILRRFSFELSPSYVHAPTLVVTLRPQFGAQVVLRKCV